MILYFYINKKLLAILYLKVDISSLEKLKKQLLVEKKSILNSLKRIGNENKKAKGHFDIRFPQYGHEKDENAREIMDFERLKAWEEEQELKLNEINNALKRIEKGDYGKCEKCAEPIREPRLNAVPAAQFCIFCANKT